MKRKMDIEINYQNVKNKPSDIYEHIPILYEYAKDCNHITECGVRTAVSSWAFAKGLVENGSPLKQLISVDLNFHENIRKLQNACEKNNINFTFLQGNDISFDFEETDLLFIDTWHIYGHLKRELAKHSPKVKKYIIMHDTEVDAIAGESIRCGHNIAEQIRDTGYSLDDITTGLKRAIDEFLIVHPEFQVHKIYTNCNGLTILKRI